MTLREVIDWARQHPMIDLVIAGVVLVLIVAVVVWWMIRSSRRDPLEGWRLSSRKWARKEDLKGLLWPVEDWLAGKCRHRLYLGRLAGRAYMTNIHGSAALFAPTTAGKTARLLAPSVMVHDGPVVAASVKPDLFRLTQAARMRRGRLCPFDPTESAGHPTWRWSPLLGVETYGDCEESAVDIVAAQQASEKDTLANKDFWDSAGRLGMAPMMWACLANNLPVGDIAWFTAHQDDVTAILRESGNQRAIEAWERFKLQEERTRANIISTINTIMEVWNREAVARALDTRYPDPARPVFDIEAFLDSTDTLYLVSPAGEQKAYASLFAAFISAIQRAVERRSTRTGRPLRPSLFLALDETGNLTPMRDLDTTMTKSAGEGVLIETVWQSEAQIIKLYGPPAARTIISNHQARVYLSGQGDLETLRGVSEWIGKDWHLEHSTNRQPGGDASTTYTRQYIEVAPPDWLGHRPRSEAVVIANGLKPARVQIPGWYEDRRMRALVDPAYAAVSDAIFTEIEVEEGS